MRHEAKITSKGQVTLPIALRKALNLKPGDKITFSQEPDGRVILQGRVETFADLRGIARRAGRSITDEEIEQWVAEAREARGRRALSGIKLRARS